MPENTDLPGRSSREQFDRQAKHYDAQWNAWTAESLSWMLDHAECRQIDDVLDVATGTGFTALAFAPHVATVTGLDVSEGMLREAAANAASRGIGNARFEVGAAESLPYPDASFDIVTCRVAPHHFLSVPRFLSEVARALRPNGRLVLADTCVPDDNPVADRWQNLIEATRDPSHMRNYAPSEWREFLHNAGLAIVELTESSSIPITLAPWVEKAGCTPEQVAEVRRQISTAPAEAREAFSVEDAREHDGSGNDGSRNDGSGNDGSGNDGSGNDARFVWRRVAILAVKGDLV